MSLRDFLVLDRPPACDAGWMARAFVLRSGVLPRGRRWRTRLSR